VKLVAEHICRQWLSLCQRAEYRHRSSCLSHLSCLCSYRRDRT